MFVVCTSVAENGDIVLASVSSWKNDLCDPTCIIDVGAHPFIRKKSYVLYRKCRIENIATIQKGLQQNVFVPLDDVDDKIVQNIVRGLLQSKQTPWQVKRFVRRISGQ